LCTEDGETPNTAALMRCSDDDASWKIAIATRSSTALSSAEHKYFAMNITREINE